MIDQQGSLAPYARLGTLAEAHNTIKLWKTQRTAIASVQHGSTCYTAENSPSVITLGKGIIDWHLQWDVPSRWVSYFWPLGEGKLLSLHWHLLVLLQARPVETSDAWNETCTIKRKEKVGVLVWHILPPVHLFMPDISSFPHHHSPSQQCWYAHMVQIPKAVATSPSKDQAPSVILEEEEDLPMQVSIKYVILALDFCCSCDVLSPDGNTFLQWAHSHAQQNDLSNFWIWGQMLPLSSSSELPWWVSPL